MQPDLLRGTVGWSELQVGSGQGSGFLLNPRTVLSLG